MADPISVLAPAKVNLTLHVTGRRADGYHLLDSLVVFADFGDRLTLTPGPEMSLEVSGPFAQGVPTDARNLVWRAAELAGWTGHIHLEKTLPHAAGIGSGSSDAGAVLRALGFRSDLAGEEVLALGADVPVCAVARPCRMQGIGDVVSPVDLPDLPIVLVNPRVEVPTGAVFAGLASRNNPPMPDDLPKFDDARDFAHWLGSQRNDLEVPALYHARVIEEVLSDLRCTGDEMLVRMSGSGATCFALYPTDIAAKYAADAIAAAHPGWWVQHGCTSRAPQ